ncbi:hypothetical protein ACIBG7_43170 [Nonomuraea sp. NPDC050328]|uniref:hypothetical protein n=1 Tax=Nonomuraea sp. NPDC050328 TaxID=3364361 RepID=UPI0037BC093C
MGKIPAQHNVDVTVRYAGDHETAVESYLDTLRVLLPGLVITITDLTAIANIWRCWHSAMSLAPKLFNGLTAAAYLISPVSTIHTAVKFSGGQAGRQVWGRVPLQSASGCGELRVRVGGLTIICDDRQAFDRQLVTWAKAWDTAKRMW